MAMPSDWKMREPERAVARVLGDLAPARLALLLERLERGRHHRHQLHDDRGRDVGHDAEREDREARQRPAREHVEHVQDAAALRLRKSSASCAGSMPGTGIWAPMRKTISAPSRNSRRRFRSPIFEKLRAESEVANAIQPWARRSPTPCPSALARLAPGSAGAAGNSTLPPAASMAARAPLDTQ